MLVPHLFIYPGSALEDNCGTLPPHIYAMQYIPSKTPFIIRAQEPDVVGDHGNAADIPLSAGKLVEVEIGDDQQDDGQHEV